MVHAVIKIDGMTCSHCQQSVHDALKAVPGVQQVEVDLEGGQAKIAYDPELASLAVFKRTIEDIGYDVRN